MSESGPVYAHDCSRCTFLGHFEDCDLYVCVARQDHQRSNVIARYGPGEDCYDGLELGKTPLKELDANFEGRRSARHILRVAYLIAADKGLLPWCVNDLYVPAIKRIAEMSEELQRLPMDNTNDNTRREDELISNIAKLSAEVHLLHRLDPSIMEG